jgi:hypothetical protein
VLTISEVRNVLIWAVTQTVPSISKQYVPSNNVGIIVAIHQRYDNNVTIMDAHFLENLKPVFFVIFASAHPLYVTESCLSFF